MPTTLKNNKKSIEGKYLNNGSINNKKLKIINKKFKVTYHLKHLNVG